MQKKKTIQGWSYYANHCTNTGASSQHDSVGKNVGIASVVSFKITILIYPSNIKLNTQMHYISLKLLMNSDAGELTWVI